MPAARATPGRTLRTRGREATRDRHRRKRACARRRDSQLALFCPCGAAAPGRAGLCRHCVHQRRDSRRRFGGHRHAVLARDREACQACGVPARVVHHRCPGVHEPDGLLTLCAACHARLHRLAAMDRYLAPALVPRY